MGDDFEELRQQLVELSARFDDFTGAWRSHVSDSLAVTRIIAAHQRRQELIGRATIAISRCLLDQETDGSDELLAEVVARLEVELDKAQGRVSSS